MENEPTQGPPNFEAVADKVFETLLTVTTILSGVFISVTFGWFGQAMIEPHPGEPMPFETIAQATVGVVLGMAFILPLVFILMAWAFSKFKGSAIWRTVSWSGLVYCLTQDFVGIVALFGFPIIAVGAADPLSMTIVTAAIPFVVLIPPVLGTVLGYRVSVGYSRWGKSEIKISKSKYALTSIFTCILILCIQALLVLTIWMR